MPGPTNDKSECLMGVLRQNPWIMLLMVLLAPQAVAQLQLFTEEAPPMAFTRDDELHGMSIDIVRMLIDRTGHDAQIRILPWTRAYHLAQRDADTAIFSTVRTPEREDRFQWVGPILEGSARFYSLKARNVQIDTLQQAAASGPLALPKQWYSYEVLKTQGFDNLYGVPTARHMVTMLKRGRVQLIATDDMTLDAVLATDDLSREQVRAHLPFMQTAYYIAFSQQTDPSVVETWRQTLAEMRQDGSYEAIIRHWLPQAGPATAIP